MNRLPFIWRHVFLLPIVFLAACSGGGDSTTEPPPDPTSAPTISAFSAASPVTNAGRAVTLSWTTSGATRLLIQPGAVDVTGQTSASVTVTEATSFALEASNSAGTTSATTAINTYDWSGLTSTLDAANGGLFSDVSGYSFLLFDRVGPLYQQAGGNIGNNEPVDLASATKLPSVAAILTLVDTRQLDLDRPIAAYLAADPDFVWPADKAAITMRMLLAHTSGIRGLADDFTTCLNDVSGISLRDCAQRIANGDLESPPGTEFNYGGVDFQVAGYVATLISGQNWQDFFQTRLGTPLALTRFSYGDSAVVTNPRIAGGAASNSEEYSRILSMVLNDGLYEGRRVLSSAMIAEILRDQIAGLPVAFAPFPEDRVADYPGYGLGVFISNPSLYPGSPGPEFSDPGLFGSTPWIDVGLGYGGVLLIESDTTTGLDIWNDLRPDIIRQLTLTPG